VELWAIALEDMVSNTLRSSVESVYRGQTVLVTGHNGFVGSWLSHWLVGVGADVVGVSLPAPTGSLAKVTQLDQFVTPYELDIRSASDLQEVVDRHRPKVVFHLAAQALVLPSYEDPLDTLTTNVLGTANVLEALRDQSSIRACVVITSDKCYDNGNHPHTEDDRLGGDDPYSASKAAAELITHAYRHSFLSKGGVGLATARAGNIIGGGDWGTHRIVPDCMRAAADGVPLVLRHPGAVRPWQHVLDAVAGYLQLGAALSAEPILFGRAWNFGPDEASSATVGDLVEQLLVAWSNRAGRHPPKPIHPNIATPHERRYLRLDSGRAHKELRWKPLLSLAATVAWTVDWYWSYLNATSGDHRVLLAHQIERYLVLDANESEATQ